MFKIFETGHVLWLAKPNRNHFKSKTVITKILKTYIWSIKTSVFSLKMSVFALNLLLNLIKIFNLNKMSVFSHKTSVFSHKISVYSNKMFIFSLKNVFCMYELTPFLAANKKYWLFFIHESILPSFFSSLTKNYSIFCW